MYISHPKKRLFVPLKCLWRSIEVPFMRYWSAVEVQLKCHLSANSDRPSPYYPQYAGAKPYVLAISDKKKTDPRTLKKNSI